MNADLPEGSDNPLNAAITNRDRSTVQMAKEAVAHKQCMLAYQPVMQAMPPHGVASYEGFIRVLDETGRIIPARDFMPVVENTEIGRDLDCIALETGLRVLRNHHDIRLSINMSARSIGYAKWMRILDRFLKKDETLGERLILEIGEKSVMTVPEIVCDFMDRLRGRGICFALDDFGSSFISLKTFRDFYFDFAKIDGQFIRGVSENFDNQLVVRSLIAIADEFGMQVIAESVETVADAEFLVEQGVDRLQGYLFGAPSVTPPWEQDEKNAVSA